MSAYVLQNPKIYYIEDRLAGRLGNANLYALALVISYVYALHGVVASRWIAIKLFFLASIPIILYLIGETGSRKGIIAAILFLIFTMILHWKFIFKQSVYIGIMVIFMFLLLIAGSSYYLYHTKHFNRVENVFSAIESGNIKKADTSFNKRLQLYNYGWNMAMKHPALGMGLNNFRVVMTGGINASRGSYSHSNMIELLVSTGFIGFIIYYCIYVSIFMKLIKISGQYRKIWTSEIREIYITTLALLGIYVIYDFAMVSYSEKLSWIILSSIIISTNIILDQTKKIKIKERSA
jgi:O-antigen ligase